MNINMTNEIINLLLWKKPQACALLQGSQAYPQITGYVYFYDYRDGSLVVWDITGLPYETGKCTGRIFGFHVHEGGSCTGDASDPFKDAGGHYNPDQCEHPKHRGDMPVVFGNEDNAWGAFYTSRFTPEEVVGKTVILHDMPDDFRSQPSGDSGEKIACGVVYELYA